DREHHPEADVVQRTLGDEAIEGAPTDGDPPLRQAPTQVPWSAAPLAQPASDPRDVDGIRHGAPPFPVTRDAPFPLLRRVGDRAGRCPPSPLARIQSYLIETYFGRVETIRDGAVMRRVDPRLASGQQPARGRSRHLTGGDPRPSRPLSGATGTASGAAFRE